MIPSETDVCKEEVYKSLFRKLAPELRNFLTYKFRDIERAEDIVQEAFIILWKSCKDVAPEKAKSFLYKVGQNQFLKLFEKDRVKNSYLQIHHSTVNTEDPAFNLEHNELDKKLRDAIENLPDGQREVFLMNRIDGKTYKEIAEVLEVSVKAVEKRMHKALVKLRKICLNL